MDYLENDLNVWSGSVILVFLPIQKISIELKTKMMTSAGDSVWKKLQAMSERKKDGWGIHNKTSNAHYNDKEIVST